MKPHMFTHRQFVYSLCALCACAVHSLALGQSRQVPAPPQSVPIVITDAGIHPVTAPDIDSGFIVLRDGQIAQIGAGAAPAVQNANKISAAGLHIYPGLIAADTTLGLTEIGDIDQTIDTTETGRIKPEVRAVVAVNPDSELIPVTRANGILTVLTFPSGGLIAGRCSAIRMDGWTWEDLAIDADAGLVINWPRSEPFTSPFARQSEDEQRTEIRGDLDAIEKVIDDANAYYQSKDAKDPRTTTDMRFEALRPYLKGEKPIFVNANTVGQIDSAAAWAERRNVKIVIVGGTQADRAVATLKRHGIPVIITGMHRLPQRRQDSYDQAYAMPARLLEAGVRFCVAPAGEAAHTRNLNHQAASAAAYGLPREEALKAVTINAAQIIGVGKTHGSLEVGKAATIIVTTGDPLDITSDVKMAFIDGRQVDLGNRHKALDEKYRLKYKQLGLLR
jgi:imidazolonepropionase-like amidohydrolase